MFKFSKPKQPLGYQLLSKDDEPEDTKLFPEWDYLDIMTVVLKIVLWCCLWAFFITLEFGAVFFIASLFYFMFTNFRKSEKKVGEISAYSVFNPNCEAIKGSLTAEQFENEIKFGLGGFR